MIYIYMNIYTHMKQSKNAKEKTYAIPIYFKTTSDILIKKE